MSNDDDKLEYDLSAWDVPPPPADLADGVIDRMGGTDVGIAVPVENPRALRRAWLIAGVAVAVVALTVGVWSLIRGSRPAAPTSGSLVADRARSLSLDTVHADLDRGADVRWRRKGDVLYVEQRAGRVAWRVDSGEKLVIDAGAAEASVEATGANLRVEVSMNATDARVIGATALTAAVVSFVTVVVYEGHVKVGRPGQQTVVVAPGTTYQVNPEAEAPVVGGTLPGDDRVVLGQRVAILGLELLPRSEAPTADAPVVVQVLSAEIRQRATKIGPYELAAGADKELVDMRLLADCASEAPECMASMGRDLGADVLVFGRVEQTRDGYHVTLKLLDVETKTISRSGSWVIPVAEAHGQGLTDWANKIYSAIVGADATACDAEALKEKGMENINMGQHAAALAQFEASLKCKHDPYVLQLAFMESCSSGNSPKAKFYYKQLTPAQQQKFGQICIRQRVEFLDDDAVADTSCDEVSCVLNNYAGACCAKFKASANDDPETLDRAAISETIVKLRPEITACGDKDSVGGKVKMRIVVNPDGSVKTAEPTAASESLGQCVAKVIKAAKFPKTQKGGTFSYPFVFPAKKQTASCDVAALKEKGMQNINMGQHAAALAQLEAAIRCEPSAELYQLAFMEACNGQHSAKAKYYYSRLTSAQQQKFAQVCIRNKVEYQDIVTPASCDAEALKDKGMENVNMGAHAAALAQFEASLKCKRDPYVLQLAFMESCSSGNAAKARYYYKLLTPDQQAKFSPICTRQNIDPTGAAPGTEPELGYLQVFSRPSAKILIDGADTRLKTPVAGTTLKLKPGKHKLTLVVGDDRFTYPVVIKAGATQTISKHLE